MADSTGSTKNPARILFRLSTQIDHPFDEQAEGELV